MKNICFIGAPGCGKTTQVTVLKEKLIDRNVYIAKATHIINIHEEAKPYLTEQEIQFIESMKSETRQVRGQGILANIEYDKILYKTIERLPQGTAVLYEGGPRGYEIVKLFLQQRHLIGETIVFHFQFPEYEYEHSISRQVYRALKKYDFSSVQEQMNRFKQKYDVYKNDTLKGLELLQQHGVPVFPINPHFSVDAISQMIENVALPYLSTKKEVFHETDCIR